MRAAREHVNSTLSEYPPEDLVASTSQHINRTATQSSIASSAPDLPSAGPSFTGPHTAFPTTNQGDGEDPGDEESASIENLSSLLFTSTYSDNGPDLDSHSRLWASCTDYQATREPVHATLSEYPLEDLVAGASRLINHTATQSSIDSTPPAPAAGTSHLNRTATQSSLASDLPHSTPIPLDLPHPVSSTDPSSPPEIPHSHLHNQNVRVLQNIESRIKHLGGELSNAPMSEISRIESELRALRVQLGKIRLKSVSDKRDRLFNALRPLFIMCAALKPREAEELGPVEINSGEASSLVLQNIHLISVKIITSSR